MTQKQICQTEQSACSTRPATLYFQQQRTALNYSLAARAARTARAVGGKAETEGRRKQPSWDGVTSDVMGMPWSRKGDRDTGTRCTTANVLFKELAHSRFQS